MKKEYQIIITYQCNWNCEYCCVDTHSRAEVPRDVVLSKIQEIENGNNVTISGGEPGMLQKTYLEEILILLTAKNCDIDLNTNGLFLTKFPELLKYIKNINYHCSENLDKEQSILRIDNISIDYLLVVHDKNLHKLEVFLNQHPNIVFNVLAAKNPEGGIMDAPILTNRFAILKKFYHRITLDSKKRLLKENGVAEIIYL